MAKAGEVLEHADVFGVAFGAAATVKQYLGDRNRMAENQNVVCVHFKTGDLTETSAGYKMTLSGMALVMFRGKFSMAISETPWAEKGDPANITDGDHAMTFVSGDGKDPRAGATKQGFVPSPNGGYHMGEVNIAPRPDGGLRPNTDYYITLRFATAEGGTPVLNLTYIGTDDAEHGGEVAIEPGSEPAQPPVEVDVDLSGAIPMSFGPMTGVFIPGA